VYEVVVNARGPVFGPQARAACTAGLHDGLITLAEFASDRVRDDYDAHHRRPSSPPYARSKIHITDDFPTVRVGSGPILYGHWLEGTGSRNATSRFKGYWSFRRSAGWTRDQAHRIVATVMARYLARVGGRAV
jgi:hypothetical protein